MSEQKTVFISYRRSTSRHLARLIYQDLRANDWDVFFDVNTIDSGDFDRIILNQIAAKAHFILLISPDSLARCVNEGDWVLQEIREAVRLNRNIVPIIEESASFEKEISYLPADLRTVLSKKNGVALHHDYFEAAMDKLRTRFLKAPVYIEISTPPPVERAEVERRMAQLETPVPSRPRSIDLMPKPFDWINIPTGNVTLTTDNRVRRGDYGYYIEADTTFQINAFAISKYPVTNGQFEQFIDAGGYREQNWWTDAGWKQCMEKNWVQPHYWQSSAWNGAEYPVVGVSWYEAVAFCLWLKNRTGENIMLPTEQQWQRAAQGDDNRIYPWGNKWNKGRCNNSVPILVFGGKSNSTTVVTQYEGKTKGDSPFGVVDMVGNVDEWCLTDYFTGNQPSAETYGRILRGGSWDTSYSDGIQCVSRLPAGADLRREWIGFRISIT